MLEITFLTNDKIQYYKTNDTMSSTTNVHQRLIRFNFHERFLKPKFRIATGVEGLHANPWLVER